MECEEEWQAMTNAVLALDTSVIALEQQAAIVSSNAQAAMAATMAYEICMNGQNFTMDDRVFTVIGDVDAAKKAVTILNNSLNTLKGLSARIMKAIREIAGG